MCEWSNVLPTCGFSSVHIALESSDNGPACFVKGCTSLKDSVWKFARFSSKMCRLFKTATCHLRHQCHMLPIQIGFQNETGEGIQRTSKGSS